MARFEHQVAPSVVEVYIMLAAAAKAGECTECESESGIWCDFSTEKHTGAGYAQSMFNMHLCKACAYDFINVDVLNSSYEDRAFKRRLNAWIQNHWIEYIDEEQPGAARRLSSIAEAAEDEPGALQD
jgi:hypothetical protein